MKTRIVRIGNSHGIRIPKPVLEQVGFPEEMELEVEGNTIVLRSASYPRQGWAEEFEAMTLAGDDVLLDAELVEASTWDEEEWEW